LIFFSKKFGGIIFITNFALSNYKFMSTTFLRLEASTGTFYEHSKEPKEGFERFEATNPQTGQIVVSFRKYHKDGMFGRLTGMHLKENKFNDRTVLTLCISLVDGENRYQAEIPYEDAKGNISSFAESFITYMPGMEKDTAYRVFPYVIEDKEKADKSGKPRKTYGVSVKYARLSDRAVDDENKVPKLQYSSLDKETGEVIKRDVPLIDWKENFKGGATMDKTERNKYLHGVVVENSIEYAGGGGTKKTFNSKEEQGSAPQPQAQQQAQAQPENVKTAEAPVAATVDDDEELPF
jgi:hypothetical protein